jgi:hypothetical protein
MSETTMGPSSEAVEAAARAIHEAMVHNPDGHDLTEHWLTHRAYYLDVARAALEAAAAVSR